MATDEVNMPSSFKALLCRTIVVVLVLVSYDASASMIGTEQAATSGYSPSHLLSPERARAEGSRLHFPLRSTRPQNSLAGDYLLREGAHFRLGGSAGAVHGKWVAAAGQHRPPPIFSVCTRLSCQVLAQHDAATCRQIPLCARVPLARAPAPPVASGTLSRTLGSAVRLAGW